MNKIFNQVICNQYVVRYLVHFLEAVYGSNNQMKRLFLGKCSELNSWQIKLLHYIGTKIIKKNSNITIKQSFNSQQIKQQGVPR